MNTEMEVPDAVNKLLNEAKLLTREDQDQLIHLLISHKMKEERTPDEVEELPDGTIKRTYWVRPEERRKIRIQRHDYFMGLLEFSYTPPARPDYVRQVLEYYSGLPRNYFRPQGVRPSVGTFFVRPMSEKEAESYVEKLAHKKGVSSQTFIKYVDELIETMSLNIFWNLAKRYEEAMCDAQSDLMYEIESHLKKKMGINLIVSEKKGEVRVLKMMDKEMIKKQIEHPRHRPQNSKQDPDEFEETLLLILYDLFSAGYPAAKITLSVLLERLRPVIGSIGVPALRARLRKCDIENWIEYRDSKIEEWKKNT